MIRTKLVAATLFAATALTACSSTVSGHGAAAGGASGGTSSTPSGGSTGSAVKGTNAAMSPAQLEKAAKAALTSATAFRIKAQFTDHGAPIGFDVHYGIDSSDGSMTVSGATVLLRYAAGDVFMNGSDEFWRLAGGLGASADGKAALALLHGKWVRVPKGTPGISDIGQLAIRTKFLQQIATSKSGETFSRGPSKTVNGVPAVSFVSDEDGTTIYVPAAGTPFPLRVEDHSADSGAFDLSQYNVPFTAPVPPASQIVDLPH